LKKWYRHRDISVFAGFLDAQLGASPIFQGLLTQLGQRLS
jgi:hypothetical protein